ncbi:MAG: DMT family transporter [Polyangiaceae bacterium]|nr:DMT family transporter [Polyangiaceae bacterium]
MLPRLAILAAALLFSTGGAAIKASTFGGWQVACLRSAIAAVAVLALVPTARRHVASWRALLIGVAYAATLVLFVQANKHTTAANSIFLQSTAPLYLLVLAPTVLKERVERRDLGLMFVLAAGLALFFVGAEPGQPSAPDPFVGNLLGVSSGLTWAFTLLGLRWLERRGAEPGAGLGGVVVGNLLAAFACLPFAWPLSYGLFGDWLLILYLGVFQIGAAYALLTRGFREVPALEVSLLILVEPALSPVWAWLFQGERPGAYAAAGGALILAASVGKAALDRRRPRAPDVELS